MHQDLDSLARGHSLVADRALRIYIASMNPHHVRLNKSALAALRVSGRAGTARAALCATPRANCWAATTIGSGVRDDRSLTIYQGFFHIACFMIILRRVLQ